MNAIEKYNLRADAVRSLLCIGLDTDTTRIPERFRKAEFPQFEFNRYVIEATSDHAAAYKLNIAFYESTGDTGFRELKMSMDYLREKHPDILTICDSKRGDVENTNEEYTKSLFDWFGFDAVTLHPYLGEKSLQPFLRRREKGCIILCRTSNPGAPEIQDLKIDGKPLWLVVAEKVRDDWNGNKN